MNFIIMINFIVGLLCILFGYQIKFMKRLDLINNYKSKNIEDEKSYANWIGFSELIIGFLYLIISIILLFTKSLVLSSIADLILLIILIILLVLGDKKFSR